MEGEGIPDLRYWYIYAAYIPKNVLVGVNWHYVKYAVSLAMGGMQNRYNVMDTDERMILNLK